MMLKTEAEGRGFQHLPRDLANVYALENNVCSLSLHKFNHNAEKNNKNDLIAILDLIAITLLIHTRTIHFYKNPRFRPWSSIVNFSKR